MRSCCTGARSCWLSARVCWRSARSVIALRSFAIVSTVRVSAAPTAQRHWQCPLGVVTFTRFYADDPTRQVSQTRLAIAGRASRGQREERDQACATEWALSGRRPQREILARRLRFWARGRSSVGRALASQARCRGFESHRPLSRSQAESLTFAGLSCLLCTYSARRSSPP